jgi:hypothetical protein
MLRDAKNVEECVAPYLFRLEGLFDKAFYNEEAYFIAHRLAWKILLQSAEKIVRASLIL